MPYSSFTLGVLVNVPAQIIAQRFFHRGGCLGGVDRPVMFETVLANVTEQPLEFWNLHNAVSAKRLQWIVYQPALSYVSRDTARKVVGRDPQVSERFGPHPP